MVKYYLKIVQIFLFQTNFFCFGGRGRTMFIGRSSTEHIKALMEFSISSFTIIVVYAI